MPAVLSAVVRFTLKMTGKEVEDYIKNELKKIDQEFPMNPPETSYVPPIMKDGSHLI